jgi:cytoskeletal protein RodZ
VPLVAPVSTPSAPPASDATTWTGEVLRQLREARGITLQQLSERTKVTRHHIENIEGDRYGALPAPVYLRGILLSLARELRLDGQKVARSYLERASAAVSGANGPSRSR